MMAADGCAAARFLLKFAVFFIKFSLRDGKLSFAILILEYYVQLGMVHKTNEPNIALIWAY